MKLIVVLLTVLFLSLTEAYLKSKFFLHKPNRGEQIQMHLKRGTNKNIQTDEETDMKEKIKLGNSFYTTKIYEIYIN